MERSEYSLLKVFKWFILKEKSIYQEMNKLKNEEKILRGFFWCPAKLKPILEERLDDIKSRRNINGP